MKYLKLILKSILYGLGSIILLTFLFTMLNYFNIINNNILNIMKIIIPLFSLALSGFIIGKNSLKNGWLEGLKLGIIIIILIFIINLIFIHDINSRNIVFYLLLLLSSILGSMFGINKKKENS